MAQVVNPQALTQIDLVSCSFLSALLEASTDQIDNFILPLAKGLQILKIKKKFKKIKKNIVWF